MYIYLPLDAIKKLNAYTKKQEEVIAKQKVNIFSIVFIPTNTLLKFKVSHAWLNFNRWNWRNLQQSYQAYRQHWTTLISN